MLELDKLLKTACLVNNAGFTQLNDAVGDGLNELMVMRGKQDVAFKVDHAVVDCCDGFQIEVIGWLVHD